MSISKWIVATAEATLFASALLALVAAPLVFVLLYAPYARPGFVCP